jgi:protein DPCD
MAGIPIPADTSALIADGRKKFHFKFENGTEMVEEYDLNSGRLLFRRNREKTALGGDGPWVFEVGTDPRMLSANDANSLLKEKNSNPICVRTDHPEAFEWRIRNMPWPKEVYAISLSEDKNQLIIRTSNRKYFKKISVPDLQRIGEVIDPRGITWDYSSQTLVLRLMKSANVREKEAERMRQLNAVKVLPV